MEREKVRDGVDRYHSYTLSFSFAATLLTEKLLPDCIVWWVGGGGVTACDVNRSQ